MDFMKFLLFFWMAMKIVKACNVTMMETQAVSINENVLPYTKKDNIRPSNLATCLNSCLANKDTCLLIQFFPVQGLCFLVTLQANKSQTNTQTYFSAIQLYGITVWMSERYELLITQVMTSDVFLISNGKPTRAKSHVNANKPMNLVDGLYDKESDIYHSKCDEFPEAWWMVNLESEYTIHQIVVWNRWGFYGELRFFNISVGVSQDLLAWADFSWNRFTSCGFYAGKPEHKDINPYNFTCEESTVGQIVAVRKEVYPDNQPDWYNFNDTCYEALHLVEVQVFGAKV